eukprot:2027428-Rhodomonas_salina.1
MGLTAGFMGCTGSEGARGERGRKGERAQIRGSAHSSSPHSSLLRRALTLPALAPTLLAFSSPSSHHSFPPLPNQPFPCHVTPNHGPAFRRLRFDVKRSQTLHPSHDCSQDLNPTPSHLPSVSRPQPPFLLSQASGQSVAAFIAFQHLRSSPLLAVLTLATALKG